MIPMKKQIISILLVLMTGSTLFSCYEDKSTQDTSELLEVIIDVTGTPYPNGRINFGYMEELNLSPKVTKNGQEAHADLSYKWSLNFIPGKIDHEVISEERELNYTLIRSIEATPYSLWLTVTDNKTTMEYQCFWNLYVESLFGEGILVAYTKDGTTSDLALIMDTPISDRKSVV